ncbi:MAG: ABC transporter permease [Acidobacteria bacterium]|nr:ABC transporter permease [Acidobacteriota bacterium]
MTRAVAQAIIVVRKELRDAFRDRRSTYSVLLGSLMGPVLVGFILNGVADRQREVQDVTIPIVGMAHAPALVDWLRQQAGVEVVEGPSDPEAAVRAREHDVVVVIPGDYATRFRASRPVEIRVVSDGSRNVTRPRVQRVRTLLQRYNAEIAALRLVGRGISPAVVQPLQLEDLEVSSAQQRAAVLLNFIPLFIVLAAFTGGMQIATDSTAGERERGSLEPLLVNPAPRAVIASGKWLAAALSSMLSVCITTTLCVAMLRVLPLQDLGIRFRLGPGHVAGLLAGVLPLCLLAPAIQAYLATFARSFKEAQSYMGFLIMVPMLPGVLSTVYPIASQPWMYPVPMLGHHLLLADVLGGKAPGPMVFVASAGVTVFASLALVRLITALLSRERIIFGR